MTPLLNSEQAAAYLGVTEACIRRWRFEKRLPAVKLGRLVRFEVAALDALIQTSREASHPSSIPCHPSSGVISHHNPAQRPRAVGASDLRKRLVEQRRGEVQNG